MERQGIATFLSQGAAGGVLGYFLMICGGILWHPNGYNFFIVIFFPYELLFGAVVGAAVGTSIWVSQKFFERSPGVLFRMLIGVLFTMLLYTVLILPGIIIDDPLGSVIIGLGLGLPAGMLTGPNIRPWHLIACGTDVPPSVKVLVSRGPIRISRTIEELKFSFLTGFPLRVASLVGLMVSLLLIACALSFMLWDEWWTGNPENLKKPLFATAYFTVTICVSCTIHRKLPVLTTALLVNIPLAVWAVKSHGIDRDTDFLINIAYFFIGCWLLFVLGVIALPKNKGALEVEYGQTEIRFGKAQWVPRSDSVNSSG